MRLVPLLSLLLLGGCWTSEPFYTPADSVHPIAPGLYRISGAEYAAPTTQVTVLPNGLTRLGGERPGEEPTIFGLLALDSDGTRFLAWPVRNETGQSEAAFYYLVERSGPGEFSIYLPLCTGEAANVAVASGASIIPDANVPACRFPNRQSIESAMRRFVADPSQPMMRLTRIDRAQ